MKKEELESLVCGCCEISELCAKEEIYCTAFEKLLELNKPKKEQPKCKNCICKKCALQKDGCLYCRFNCTEPINSECYLFIQKDEQKETWHGCKSCRIFKKDSKSPDFCSGTHRPEGCNSWETKEE